MKNDQLRRKLVHEMELEQQLTEARTRVADKAADNHEHKLELLQQKLELSRKEASRMSAEKRSLQRTIKQLKKLADEQQERTYAIETKQGTSGLLPESKHAKKEIKKLKTRKRNLENTVFRQKGEIEHLNKKFRRLQKQLGSVESDQARRILTRCEENLLRDPIFAREQLQSWISTVRQYLCAGSWNDNDTVRRFGRLLTKDEKTKGKATFRQLDASSCHHFQEYLDVVSLIDDIEPINLFLEEIFEPAWDMLPEHAWKAVLTKMVQSEPRQRYERIRKSIGKRWGKWKLSGDKSSRDETDPNRSASEISEESSSD